MSNPLPFLTVTWGWTPWSGVSHEAERKTLWTFWHTHSFRGNRDVGRVFMFVLMMCLLCL